MKDHEIIELLRLCHPVYLNLHDKIGHALSKEEAALMQQFKSVWENGLCCDLELIEEAGISHYELAFLGGYIYYAHQLVAS